MIRKIELSIDQLKLIQHALTQYKHELPATIAIYISDNEIDTAKAFADDLIQCDVLIDFIDNLKLNQ